MHERRRATWRKWGALALVAATCVACADGSDSSEPTGKAETARLDFQLKDMNGADVGTLAELEHVVTERCRVLQRDQLKPGTNFHWWPKPDIPA